MRSKDPAAAEKLSPKKLAACRPRSVSSLSTASTQGAKASSQPATPKLGPEIRAEVLRGVRLSDALSRAGALWRTSPVDLEPKAQQSIHSKSEPCEHLDAFLSQTWATPGWEKYLTLLVHYYWRPAAFAGILSAVALCVLDLAGRLPTITVDEPDLLLGGVVEVCPWSPVPPLISLAVLFLGPALRLRRDPLLFFDAVCINQHDPELKVEGIYSLGGFLAKSSALNVLWAPEYLRRIWCVYELAMFSAVGNISEIFWMPVFEGKLLFFMFCVNELMSISNDLAIMKLPIATMLVSTVPVHNFLTAFFYMPFVRSLQQLTEQFEGFSVREAQCREDRDRKIITESIVDLYGSEDSFDRYVRGPLKSNVMSSIPRVGVTYKQLLGMLSPVILSAVQLNCAVARAGYPLAQSFRMYVTYAMHVMLVIPMNYNLIFLLAALGARYWTSRAADVACSVLISIFSTAVFVLFVLVSVGQGEPNYTWAYCTVVLVSAFSMFQLPGLWRNLPLCRAHLS